MTLYRGVEILLQTPFDFVMPIHEGREKRRPIIVNFWIPILVFLAGYDPICLTPILEIQPKTLSMNQISQRQSYISQQWYLQDLQSPIWNTHILQPLWTQLPALQYTKIYHNEHTKEVDYSFIYYLKSTKTWCICIE